MSIWLLVLIIFIVIVVVGAIGTGLGAVLGWFAREKFSAVLVLDVVGGEQFWIDEETIDKADDRGMQKVVEKRGPFGLFSRPRVVPTLYPLRTGKGKHVLAYLTPESAFLEAVNAGYRVTKKQLMDAEIAVGELGFKLSKAEHMTKEEVKKAVAEVIKNIKEVHGYQDWGGRKK